MGCIAEVVLCGGVGVPVVVVVVACFGITVVDVFEADDVIFFGTFAESAIGPPPSGCKNDLFPRIFDGFTSALDVDTCVFGFNSAISGL